MKVSALTLALVASGSNAARLRSLLGFDLDAQQVVLGGISFLARDAQSLCPDAWQNYVGCVISDCPQFPDVCPGGMGMGLVPEEGSK